MVKNDTPFTINDGEYFVKFRGLQQFILAG